MSGTLDQFDLCAFDVHYSGDGRRRSPCELQMMAKLLVYAYPTQVLSSRRIARRRVEDVTLHLLAARIIPAHRKLRELGPQP